VLSLARLREVGGWVSGDEALEARVEQAVNAVLDGYKLQLNAFIVAMARRAVHRVVMLVEQMDAAEVAAMSPKHLQNAHLDQLIRLMNNLQHQLDRAMDLIKELVLGPPIQIKLSDERTLNVFDLSEVDVSKRESRERLRQVFSRLYEKFSPQLVDGNGTNGTPHSDPEAGGGSDGNPT